ncbi:MAG: hypothetical protein OXG44_12040 [Gammaproteobacteria bacterium]|nr:hypothetical protein [Gammaproteobacteria bacterium]
MTIVLAADQSIGNPQEPAGGWYIATVMQRPSEGKCILQQSHDGETWVDTDVEFEADGLGVWAFLTSLGIRIRFNPTMAGWVIDAASARDEGPAEGRLP